MRHTGMYLGLGLVLQGAAVLTTVACAIGLEQSAAEEQRVRFEREVDQTVAAAKSRLQQYEVVLRAGLGLFQASRSVERAEWHAFVQTLDVERKFPGCLGFGRIDRVPPETLPTYLEQQRADGAPQFTVRTLGPRQGESWIIGFIEPLSRNASAQGLDIASEERRRVAAEAAMHSGSMAITRVIPLVQDQERRPGFLMLLPHYRGATIPATDSERRDACIGWIYAPLVGEWVVADLLAGHPPHLAMAVYDGQESEINRIVGDPQRLGGSLRTSRTLPIGTQTWTFVASSQAADRSLTPLTLTVLASGLAISSGLLAVLFLLFRSSRLSLRQAEQAASEARKAAAAKTRFLATMSHELRTPLGGVIGLAELALLDDMPMTVRTRLQGIQVSGETLLALINDVLDFSRFSAGDFPLEHRGFDLHQEAVTVRDLLLGAAHQRGLTLTLNGPDPLWVQGDALRVRQILLNLVGNAVKFTEAGRVDIFLAQTNDGLTLTVADSGIGMDDDTMARLFAPFSQAESSTPRRFGGTGLGLSIVKLLVDRMGGTVAVTSRLAVGSTFTVHLPLPPSPPAPTTDQPRPAWKPLHLRILLAEDLPLNQEVVAALLRHLGCTVTLVADGEAAVAQATGHDVILMDCQMPVMDGLEATRRLRAAGVGMPILALTANASDEDRNACRAAGMDDVLAKPVTLEALATMLDRWAHPHA